MWGKYSCFMSVHVSLHPTNQYMFSTSHMLLLLLLSHDAAKQPVMFVVSFVLLVQFRFRVWVQGPRTGFGFGLVQRDTTEWSSRVSHSLTHVMAAHLEVFELQVTWHVNRNVIPTKHTLSNPPTTSSNISVCVIQVWQQVCTVAVSSPQRFPRETRETSEVDCQRPSVSIRVSQEQTQLKLLPLQA